MAPTRIVVKDPSFKNYLFKKYINAEEVLRNLGVEIIAPNTEGDTSVGKVRGFPDKYLGIFNHILKNNVKIIIFNKHLLFEPNSTFINEFFSGKILGAEKMRFVEKGSTPSEKYFFFSIEMQKRYSDKLNAVSSSTKITYPHDKFGRPTKDKKKKRLTSRVKKKQFEIRKGRDGKGIFAIWNNFHKGGQTLLKVVYGGKPFWPGFKGLEIEKKAIQYYYNDNNIAKINRDKVVLEYVKNLYGFDLSIASIDFSDIDLKQKETKVSGKAKIKQDERKLEAIENGPLTNLYESVKRAILDLFK